MVMGDLGSIRIENETSQPSLVAPVIPVRPNSTIPVLMGLLLVLGGILVLFMGYSEISRHRVDTHITDHVVETRPSPNRSYCPFRTGFSGAGRRI